MNPVEALDSLVKKVDALGTISEQIVHGVSNMHAQVKALRADVDGLVTDELVKGERITTLETRVGAQERQVGVVLNRLGDLSTLMAQIAAKL